MSNFMTLCIRNTKNKSQSLKKQKKRKRNTKTNIPLIKPTAMLIENRITTLLRKKRN